MNASRNSVLIFVLMALISISVKIIFSYPVDYVLQWPGFRVSIITELRKKGYNTILMFEGGVVVANAGTCTLYIYNSRPEGGDDELRLKQLPNAGDLVFWYDGGIYGTRPILWPILMRNSFRFLNAVGFQRKFYPVFGVISSSNCDTSELATLPFNIPSASEK